MKAPKMPKALSSRLSTAEVGKKITAGRQCAAATGPVRGEVETFTEERVEA